MSRQPMAHSAVAQDPAPQRSASRATKAGKRKASAQNTATPTATPTAAPTTAPTTAPTAESAQGKKAQPKQPAAQRSRLARLLYENGLTIALLVLFFIFITAQSISGQLTYNNEQQEHGQPPVSYWDYLKTGAFIESVGENWESEFLQMSAYVVMTVFLVQKGSADSKSPDEKEETDRDPAQQTPRPDAPWPVRKGGWVLKLYENSLSLALFLLFLASFVIHLWGGGLAYNEDLAAHGQAAIPVLAYLFTPRFWFESFQNWQSEFLSIACMVVFSIYLRQRGSSQSKPVDSPHSETGD